MANEKDRERTRKWHEDNRERFRQYQAEWYVKNRDYHRGYMRNYRLDPAKRERQRDLERARDDRLRRDVLDAYGGPQCACCGEDVQRFLTIDHINNDGAKHRKEIGEKRGGRKFYEWLKKNGYPEGFQILCMNCNWGKHRNGGTCPHLSEGSTTRAKARTAEVSTSAAGSARHPMDYFYRPGVEEIVSTWQ